MRVSVLGAVSSWLVRGFVAMAMVSTLAGCRVEVGTPANTAASTPRQSDVDGPPHGRVVLYTSAYREVTDAISSLARETLPDVELVLFQGGSEKVASRLDADLAAGRAGADVLMVSDPFLIRRLKRDGHLRPYASPRATPIDRRLVDLDNHWVAARVSTMVIAFHTGKTSRAEVPTTLQRALVDEDGPAADVAFGDPLSSGTAFMTTMVIGQGDPAFLGSLRRRGAAVAGGNSVVLQRVLSGERRFGVVLLENVLLARDRGEPIGFVVPDDGAVIIAGDIAILKDTANADAARAVVDLILSPAGQAVIRGAAGRMHAADPRQPPPADDVPTLSSLLDARPVDEALLARISADRAGALRAVETALLHDVASAGP